MNRQESIACSNGRGDEGHARLLVSILPYHVTRSDRQIRIPTGKMSVLRTLWIMEKAEEFPTRIPRMKGCGRIAMG